MAIDASSVVNFMKLDTSKFTEGLNSAGEKMKEFTNSTNSLAVRIKSLGDAMQITGRTSIDGVTSPLVNVGTSAVKTSMNFEEKMSKVKENLKPTSNEFENLKDKAIQLGSETGFSASNVAEGMNNIASSGFTTKQVIESMPNILNLAAAGNTDVATASDVASSAMRDFGMEADKTYHITDALAKESVNTKSGIKETGEALKSAAPAAHALGISFEDTTAAIGILSKAGIKGSEAGGILKEAFTNMLNPTNDASQLMKKLGLNFFDANGKMLPLGNVLQQLKEKTSGLTAQQKASAYQTLFGSNAMSGMLAIVDQGPDKFKNFSRELKNCDGASKEISNTMKGNLKGSIDSMKSSIDSVGIKLGDALVPTIKLVTKVITELANAFTRLPKSVQTFIANVLLAAAAFGPVIVSLGKVVSSTQLIIKAFSGLTSAARVFRLLPALINPPVLITVAIIAGLSFVVYEVIKHWDYFKKYVIGFGTTIKNVFKKLSDFIHKVVLGWQFIFKEFSTLLGKIIEGWKAIFKEFGEFLGKIGEGWKTIFKNLGDGMFEIGKFIFSGLFNGISSMAEKIKDKVLYIAKIIKNGITEPLGIQSPSTVFTEYGVNTGQGYINGIDKMQNPIKNKFLALANGIKYLGNTKVKLDNFALSGAYEKLSARSNGLSKTNRSSKFLNFEPKINLYVTVADTGEKGTAKLAGEFKSMTQNALKNAMTDLFMNDVLRD